MKAIAFEMPGSPEVLRLVDIPAPTIQKETEVLVQLRAAGINPIDTKLRARGTFYREKSPHVLGCDGAGVVAAVGAAVQGFQVGDEVFFCNGGLGGPIGTYAELAVVDERFLARKPAALSFAEAATAPLILITVSIPSRGKVNCDPKLLPINGKLSLRLVSIPSRGKVNCDRTSNWRSKKSFTTVSIPSRGKVNCDSNLKLIHCKN